MVRLDKGVACLRVGADNVRGKFRRQFVVEIVLPLVFREVLGVVQLDRKSVV